MSRENWRDIFTQPTRCASYGPFRRDVAPAVVDQREVQSNCPVNAYSCFFCSVLCFLERAYGEIEDILDLTYGRGSFYLACRKYRVVAADVAKWDWLVEPEDFVLADAFRLPVRRKRFDAVVVDPPYGTELNHMLDLASHVLLHGAERWNVERLVQLVKRLRPMGRFVVVKYQPKEWKELAPLFTQNPLHVFIFRTVKQRVFKNPPYYKNFTILFVF